MAGGLATKEQQPPVWPLFLSALSVLLLQFPSAFEYSQEFLTWLEQEAVSARFGKFPFTIGVFSCFLLC